MKPSRESLAVLLGAVGLLVAACQTAPEAVRRTALTTVADTLSNAQAADGRYISWREHLVDDEVTNGGVPIRGGDGLVVADVDGDGIRDIISVHEDSNHLRIAFGTADPDTWTNITLGTGDEVAAIEDVAVGDLNGDGHPDVVAACEEAHLIYFQNPGKTPRTTTWARVIPEVTRNRGSWLRVFMADVDGDGRMDVLGANKGAADIIDPSLASAARPTSLFRIDGDPLQSPSWHEQVLSLEVVPNTATPVDIDDDGDIDVLAAARLHQTLTLLENAGRREEGGVRVVPHPVIIAPGFPVPVDWRGTSNGFQTAFGDIDADGRKDLVVAVYETPSSIQGTPLMARLGWLKQPGDLDAPWIYYPIGDILPDVVIGIALVDIDGDGDLDAITGGYSGLNILKGGYTGASRDHDEPSVTASSSVGRIAWFENPGDPTVLWTRHDISRRVRGMYDSFIPQDMNGDGDIDFIATRGNSGEYDGVFWIEQVRTEHPAGAFTPARSEESRSLPLPPADWADHYYNTVTFVAPNKAGQK